MRKQSTEICADKPTGARDQFFSHFWEEPKSPEKFQEEQIDAQVFFFFFFLFFKLGAVERVGHVELLMKEHLRITRDAKQQAIHAGHRLKCFLGGQILGIPKTAMLYSLNAGRKTRTSCSYLFSRIWF